MSAVARVRTGRPADVAEVVRMWRALGDNGHVSDPRFELADDAQARFAPFVRSAWLDATLPFPGLWVADDDEGLLGFVAGKPVSVSPVLRYRTTALITDMWVEDRGRRRGIGRALVTAFVEAAAEAGYADCEVNTLTRDARAVAFWQAMGFGDWMVRLRR